MFAVKLAVCAKATTMHKMNQAVSAVFLLNIVDLGLLAVFKKVVIENVSWLQKLFLCQKKM
jgi:hypothetical protein